MISFGQPFKEVQKAYMKKFKKQLSRTTFNRWKTDADAILAAGKKPGASRHSYKLADIKESFDKDLMKKIEETYIDVEGIQGLKDLAIKRPLVLCELEIFLSNLSAAISTRAAEAKSRT